jgi:lipopolysaccharide export system protein LptA
MASSADLKHDSQITTFHGVPGKPARLWQGTSQVDAPVLEFDQKQKRLVARGEGQGEPMAVHAAMMNSKSAQAPAKRSLAAPAGVASKAGRSGAVDVIRVASREMTYSDEARKAEFIGGVDVETGDGSMRAEQATVYLQPVPAGGSGKNAATNGNKASGAKTAFAPGAAEIFMGGKVEKMVASGHVEMVQPGRRATGEQVVYTASDGVYVLTGTPTVLPKVVDDQRGTVTGTSLRLRSDDDDVVVSNGGGNDAGRRVRTETRVKNKQ